MRTCNNEPHRRTGENRKRKREQVYPFPLNPFTPVRLYA
jgi:hypothetical protein